MALAVTPPNARSILCLSSYFKGNRFLTRCRAEGVRVVFLTLQSRADEPWDRSAIDEFYCMPTFADRHAVINALGHVMRDRPIDVFVALDDFDVEFVASLREHFRIPGMGETTARYFRDKLAMRYKAMETGLMVPQFTDLVSSAKVDQFLARVPAPWLLKPRSQASAIGIKTLAGAEQAREVIRSLGDQRTHYLLEQMIPGELYHVDSLVSEGHVVFELASKYHRPLLEVYQGGGVFASRTLAPSAPDAAQALALNRNLLRKFGLIRGSSHTEFMRASSDGEWYFIETSARVGGAGVSDMIEAATGINPWEEWASIELRHRTLYVPPTTRSYYGGVIMSLARQRDPDTSSFVDPEIYRRLDHPNHIGLVVGSPDPSRVGDLLTDYQRRILDQFHATMPPAERATF